MRRSPLRSAWAGSGPRGGGGKRSGVLGRCKYGRALLLGQHGLLLLLGRPGSRLGQGRPQSGPHLDGPGTRVVEGWPLAGRRAAGALPSRGAGAGAAPASR
jgi:hypothetical protein